MPMLVSQPHEILFNYSRVPLKFSSTSPPGDSNIQPGLKVTIPEKDEDFVTDCMMKGERSNFFSIIIS